MKISFTPKPICNICLGGFIDEEHKRIIEKLLALGLQPTGNKSSDKNILHRHEMQQLRTELGAKGQGTVNKSNYLTISTNEIENIKNSLKMNSTPDDNDENSNNKESIENFTGSTQNALINKYFIGKKKNKIT